MDDTFGGGLFQAGFKNLVIPQNEVKKAVIGLMWADTVNKTSALIHDMARYNEQAIPGVLFLQVRFNDTLNMWTNSTLPPTLLDSFNKLEQEAAYHAKQDEVKQLCLDPGLLAAFPATGQSSFRV